MGNQKVRRYQLQMWLGFVGFMLVMAVISMIGTMVLGRALEPAAVIIALILAVAFGVLAARYRSLH